MADDAKRHAAKQLKQRTSSLSATARQRGKHGAKP